MSDIMYFKTKISKNEIEQQLLNPNSWKTPNFPLFPSSGDHTIFGFRNIDFDQFDFGGKKIKNLIFENCDLRKCSFFNTELSDIHFINCNLEQVYFYRSTLNKIQFEYGTLEHSNLMCRMSNCAFKDVDMSESCLVGCNISNSEFKNVNLTNSKWDRSTVSSVNFQYSNLKKASMINVSFNNISFHEVNFTDINLSESTGLLDPISYIDKNFEKTDFGIVVYKIFNCYYKQNPMWIIKKDSIIREEINYDRTCSCACGINVATGSWTLRYLRDKVNDLDIWKCFIRYEWHSGVVVPYNTTGQIRTSRLQLFDKISKEKLCV